MTDYTKLIERADPFMQGLGKAILREIAASIEALQTTQDRQSMQLAHDAVTIEGLNDKVMALLAENERLMQDIAEWRDATTAANTNANSETRRREDMQEQRDTWTRMAEALQAKLDAMGKGEPIYQYQMGDGSWIDQTKHSYDYNRNHAPNAVVRIVYAAPKAMALTTWQPASNPPPESAGEVLVRMADGRREIAWPTYWHGSSNAFSQWTFRDPDEDEQPVEWMTIPAHGIGGTQ